jgi:4-amino-4-deoxy-L-arabinose transferase-like glycosyltransferase
MVTKSKTKAQTKEAEGPVVSDWKLAFVLAAGLLLARTLYIWLVCPYALGPDEAQYWHWSLHPDWSYVTKPPLTTSAIWLATKILGQNEFAVRLFALFGQTALLLTGFALARMLGGPNGKRAAGWWAFALLATAPVTAFGGLFMAPDVLLLPLYLAALTLLAMQLTHERRNRWLLIGALVGLAGLAKYSAAFFYPLAGLYALIWRRQWLLNPWFYISGLIALALQTPVIYWNLAHHLEGLQHVAWQANAHDARHGNLGTILNFLLGQLAIFGPIVFALMAAAVTAAVRHTQRLKPLQGLLFIFIVPLFLAFTLENLVSKVQPNWPILATIPAVILLAAWLPTQNAFVKKTAIVGVVFNALLSLLLSNALWFGFPSLIKPLREMLGVREIANMTAYILTKLDPTTVIVAGNYGTVARQAFYVPGMALNTIYIRPEGERATEYDLWPWPEMKGKLALYVAEGKERSLPAAVATHFGHCEYVTSAEIKRGEKPLRQAAYYLCANAK